MPPGHLKSTLCSVNQVLSQTKWELCEIMNKILWRGAIRNHFPETAGNKTLTQLTLKVISAHSNGKSRKRSPAS